MVMVCGGHLPGRAGDDRSRICDNARHYRCERLCRKRLANAGRRGCHALGAKSERLGVTPLEGLVVEAEVQGDPVAQAGVWGFLVRPWARSRRE